MVLNPSYGDRGIILAIAREVEHQQAQAAVSHPAFWAHIQELCSQLQSEGIAINPEEI